jgi:transposase InsO family protein
VSHRNAPLSELGRLRLARCVVDEGWPLRRAAERFQVAVPTAARWAKRYRERDLDLDPLLAMRDRSSRPVRSPQQTRARVERRISHLRRTRGWGAARIAHKLGLNPSKVGRVLVRRGHPPLAHLDLATRRELRGKIRRYERERPGELVHVDIKKLGRIPDGGGHRVHGRSEQFRGRGIGYAYVHTAIDDHSRLAYSEILGDETAVTTAAWWTRAIAWFAAHGIRIERVLTDNGGCYRSREWHQVSAAHGIIVKKTRPFRPQTNGKAERFNRTLLTEWAYARAYRSDRARSRALPGWLHIYNHHRTHTALGGHPPISRVTNLPGQYI